MLKTVENIILIIQKNIFFKSLLNKHENAAGTEHKNGSSRVPAADTVAYRLAASPSAQGSRSPTRLLRTDRGVRLGSDT